MHAGALESRADGELASGFHDPGRSTEALCLELRITHSLAIPMQVLEALPRLLMRIRVTANGAE
ncbi:MAG: hypothetical protein JO062_22410 [Bryobacterales bacterium]|nr:hypothetical protein [Bryobacterales bacterium]